MAARIAFGSPYHFLFASLCDSDNRTSIIPDRHFPHDRKLLAIDYLEQAIVAVRAGELDALLSKTLADMTARFSVTPAIEEEKPSNVLALQAA